MNYFQEMDVKSLYSLLKTSIRPFKDNCTTTECGDFKEVPLEILSIIFQGLSLANRVKCALSCKKFLWLENKEAIHLYAIGISCGEENIKLQIKHYDTGLFPLRTHEKRVLDLVQKPSHRYHQTLFNAGIESIVLPANWRWHAVRSLEKNSLFGCIKSRVTKLLISLNNLKETGESQSKFFVVKDLLTQITYAANNGSREAQIVIGKLLCTGHFTLEKDFERGIRILEAATSNGSMESAFVAGMCLEKDLIHEWSQKRAAECYKIAADGGSAEAQFKMAMCYQTGTLFPLDKSLGHHYLEKAAELGHQEALVYLGINYAKGLGVSHDHAKAVQHFLSVKEKNLIVLSFLCRFYATGIGVEIDQKKAAHYFNLLKEKSPSCEYHYQMGICLAHGFGTKKDAAASIDHLIKCENQDEYARYLVGEYYENQKDNLIEAVRRYCFAADRGHPLAQYKLCVFYSEGHGVEKDAMWASFYFKQLIDNERPYRLGQRYAHISTCYEKGYGTSPNPRLAAHYFKVAAEKGYAKAQFELAKGYSTDRKEDASYYFSLLNNPNHPERDHDVEKRYQMIAICLQEGYGTEKDNNEARRFFKLYEKIINN